MGGSKLDCDLRTGDSSQSSHLLVCGARRVRWRSLSIAGKRAQFGVSGGLASGCWRILWIGEDWMFPDRHFSFELAQVAEANIERSLAVWGRDADDHRGFRYGYEANAVVDLEAVLTKFPLPLRGHFCLYRINHRRVGAVIDAAQLASVFEVSDNAEKFDTGAVFG